MKYCEFCGKEIPEGKKCDCTVAVQKAVKTQKYIKLGALIGIPLLIVILIVASVVGSLKVDPSTYLEGPEFIGTDTMGTVEISFNKKALITSIIGEEPTSFEDLPEWVELYDEYADGIEFEYTSGKLSNGDNFTVSITTTGIAAEEIKSWEKTFTVEGLADVETADIFKSVEVSFSGLSGNGRAKVAITSDDEMANACNFQIEPQHDLKNGDVVTVTISNAESIFDTYTVVPKEVSKQFTVSGLGSYATVESLPMDTIREIANQFVAERETENEHDTASYLTFSPVRIHGIYFAEKKEGASFCNTNELHILIAYDKYMDGNFDETIYLPLIFENLVSDSEGGMEILYEDGHGSIFAYTDAEKYLAGLDGDFDVTKIE